MLETLQPFAMSLLIGLVIGIERERRNREGQDTMGVRSYALVALTGTCVAAAGSMVLLGAVGAMIGALVAIGYWRMTQLPDRRPDGESDYGLTSEMAAVLVFVLGFVAYTEPLLSGIIGLTAVTLLFSRRFLHDFARNVLKTSEISAALTLAAFAFIVVPFLPDKALDPWGILNLRQLGTIIAVIGAIEFGGYAIERLGGARLGRLATGFFGGLASSTAVFVSLPKLVRETPGSLPYNVGAGLMANAASLGMMVGILAMTSTNLMVPVGIPVAVSAFACVLLAFVAVWRSDASDLPNVERKNPLDFRGALKLGLVIFGLLAVTAIAKRTLGIEAVGVVSFISGLFELHGVTIANATLEVSGELSTRSATVACYLAATAAYLSKIGIVWVSRLTKFAATLSVFLVIAYAAGAVAALVLWQL